MCMHPYLQWHEGRSQVGYWAWSPGVVAIASSGGIGVGGEGGGANRYEGGGG